MNHNLEEQLFWINPDQHPTQAVALQPEELTIMMDLENSGAMIRNSFTMWIKLSANTGEDTENNEHS